MNKLFKRVAALAMTGVLTLTMAACTSGKSADALLATAGENLKKQTSLNASYYTEMTYTMGEESAQSVNTMELTVIDTPALRIKADIAMTMSGVAAQEMTMYTVDVDGVPTQYLTDGTDWFKAPADETVRQKYDVWESMNKYLTLTDGMKEAGSDTLDGRAATKLTGGISGKNLVQTLEDGGMLAGIATMSEDQQTKIKADLEGLSALVVTLWVDKEGNYPAKFEADFTKTIAEVTAQISKTLGGFSTTDTPTMTGVVIRIACTNVGTAADFELPAQAADAEEVTNDTE